MFVWTNDVHQLAADNEHSFVSLFVSFLFQGFSVIIFDHDFCSNLRSSLSFRSFIQIRWNKRLDLRLEALFCLTNLNKILVLWNLTLVQISNRILFLSQFEFRCSVRFDSFCKPEFLSWTFWLDLLIWVLPVHLCLIAYVCYCLFVIEFPECEACYIESLGSTDRRQGK